MLKKLRFIVAALVLSATSLIPAHAFAAGTSGYSVSPSRIVLSANPGQAKLINISLSNLHKSEQYTLNVTPLNYSLKPDGSPNPERGLQPEFGLASWIKGPSSVLLGAGYSETYEARLEVPKTAKTGAYYGMVLFNNRDNANDPAVGVVVVANVGAVSAQLSIESFNTDALAITNQWKLLGEAKVLLRSSGNGYLVPARIVLEIVDETGAVVESVNAQVGEDGVLPGSTRAYTINASKLLAPNKPYNARVQVFSSATEPAKVATNKLTTPTISAPAKTPAVASKPSTPKKNIILVAGVLFILFLGVLLAILLRRDRAKKAAAAPLAPSQSMPGELTANQEPTMPNATQDPYESGER